MYNKAVFPGKYIPGVRAADALEQERRARAGDHEAPIRQDGLAGPATSREMAGRGVA